METNRRRGQSFYEEQPSAASSSPSKFAVPQGAGTGGSVAAAAAATTAAAFTSIGREYSMDASGSLLASRSDSSDAEHSRSSGSGSDSSGEGGARTSSDEIDDAEEDAKFSRGRTRSRSICGPAPDAPDGTPASGIIKFDPSAPPAAGPKREVAEPAPLAAKSGPLAQREIQVLKKGLEEAIVTRPKDLVLEEEEERLAAATEKRDRVEHKSSVPSYTLGSENQNVKRWKILMLGDSGVGKSSLIMRWTADTFSSSLVGTVGVNFKSKKVQCGGGVLVWFWFGCVFRTPPYPHTHLSTYLHTLTHPFANP